MMLDATFLPSRRSYMFHSGKLRQPCRALQPSGRLVLASPASLSVCISISSCNVYGGFLLLVCPLTQSDEIVVCFVVWTH
jgi:hypothetical protein